MSMELDKSPGEMEWQALRRAIEDLYTVFRRYPLRPQVVGCAHCVSEEDNAILHSKPLRELSAEDLDRFGYKALTTWGDQDDLRHFLPRLLECVVEQHGGGLVDPEIVLGKLSYSVTPGKGGWRHWPQAQQAAIAKFLLAWWRWALAQFADDGLQAMDCLCAIAQAEDDLMGYLELWAQDGRAPACQHLAAYAMSCGNRLIRTGHLGNAFWEARPQHARQVIAWLAEPERRAALEQAFFAYGTAPFAADLSLAVSVFEAISARYNPDAQEPTA